MGLAERRATKDFQDTDFPALKQRIASAAHFEVPIEVAWDQLATPEQQHLYKEAWPEIYFVPLIEAFASIARDDMGREALKAGLKKIVLKNEKGAYSPHNAIDFTGGTLTIDHSLTNVGDTADRTKYLIEIVEKAL